MWQPYTLIRSWEPLSEMPQIRQAARKHQILRYLWKILKYSRNTAAQAVASRHGGAMNIEEAGRVLRNSLPRPFDGAAFELVKVSEAAERCGLHPRTIRKRIARGELPAWGRPVRVRWRDVLPPFEPRAGNGDRAARK
jgi:excisionase family DNA binding protein